MLFCSFTFHERSGFHSYFLAKLFPQFCSCNGNDLLSFMNGTVNNDIVNNKKGHNIVNDIMNDIAANNKRVTI